MLQTYRELDTGSHAHQQIEANTGLAPELREGICQAIQSGCLSHGFLILRTPEELDQIQRTLEELNEAASFASDLRKLRGLLAKICDGLVGATDIAAPILSALGMDASKLIRVRNTYSPVNFLMTIGGLQMDLQNFRRTNNLPTIGRLGQEALPVAK